MRRISMSLLLLAALAILSAGCRTPTRVPLNQDVQARIPSTDVIIALNQEEIYAEINQSRISQGTGGGLIPALIDAIVDNSRSKNAEAAIAPVRNAMLGYSCGAELQKSVQEGLAKVEWLHVSSVKQEQPYSDSVKDKILQGASTSAVLIMNTRYYLTHDFDTLQISSEVSVYPVSADLKTLAAKLDPNRDPPLLYRNRLTVSSPLLGEFDDKEKASAAWCADSGKLVRSSMSDGIAELSRMLVLDLAEARSQARGERRQAEAGREIRYGADYGTVIAETPGRVVFRDAAGELHSAPKDLVE
jgi:hypothetical protein